MPIEPLPKFRPSVGGSEVAPIEQRRRGLRADIATGFSGGLYTCAYRILAEAFYLPAVSLSSSTHR